MNQAWIVCKLLPDSVYLPSW